MGRKDTALKQYLENDTRFADLINGMLGKGKIQKNIAQIS
jgi:hypothetical protein